ncbi:MAG: hypothetical protein JXB42_06590 [Deltaproteobacteria bacterium]|nr:hypothetical protein [Deltaproteobacteria bacterium]
MRMTMSTRARGVVYPALFMLMVCFSMSGCSLGPKALKGNRLDYNVSIQKSNNEELLINLVRAKYYEPLFFLQVGSISSSFSYTVDAGLAGTIFSKGSDAFANYASPSLGAGYGEKPTITYTPVQGEQAVKQLMEEISLDRFLLLTRVGWSIDSLMWTIVQRIGELHNFEPDMAKSVADPYGKFLDLAEIFRQMQSRGDIELVGIDKEGKGTMQLRYAGPKEAEEVENLLEIKPERINAPDGKLISSIKLTPARDLTIGLRGTERCNEVPIKFKSCFGMLYDLARNVEVPGKDVKMGLTQDFEPLGENIMKRKGLHLGLINVRSSSARPGDAYVSVFYRGRWYYIADDDARSKAYFVLVGMIFSLQAGELHTAQPLLTLPVNQ